MRIRPTVVLFSSLALLAGLGLTLTACHQYAYRAHDESPAVNRRYQPVEPRDRDGYRRDLRSGTLTAGHFDDGQDPARFAQWADQVDTLGPEHGFVSGFDQPAIQLTILNEHGDPVHNATVRVQGSRLSSDRVIRSGTDGRCVILPGYDAVDRGVLQISVAAEGSRTMRHSLSAGPGDSVDVVMHGSSSRLPEKLDLALVIDTTGSMSDELEYLKVEFRAIVERIAERFPQVDQRWALVVYRDKGDAYVVKDYEFTSSVGKMVDRLGDQRAGGGGDYPEAVDEAMQQTAGLGWRDDAAKVAFLIADAPPHAERSEDAIAQASVMRGQGVALYPVASSGVQAEAEHFFRAAALLTGGGYSFLTDDSGVGNPHGEPHEAPSYSVQRLDDLIVQLVESELTGQTRGPQRRDIVREVPEVQDEHDQP